MFLKAATLLSLALCVLGDGHAISEQKIVKHYGEISHIGSKEPEHHEEYAWSYPSYEFSYKVDDPHTHDKKGQSETRHGDEVKGEYWLYEPDGRKRTVKYHADKKSGFKAIVEYSAPHHHVYYKTKDHEEVKEHKDHKPVVEHVEEEVHIQEEHKEDKHAQHNIPMLSIHAPRVYKFQEDGYYHPRNLKYNRGYNH
ncbi:uncharacterized protein LOC114359450 [Ostrinia furnacalis]|uniref:uncharacterized protein LOC114359450 n=1 Tax=Ostrinia furnacalis TaxID=93504 RepID=UPI00103BF34F|nr:uncharacterized protein LOC114359450 [Ostrinia furnacalis]